VSESGLHDEFKRLLLSLPCQPIIGRDYSIYWSSEERDQKYVEKAYVQYFYEAAGEEYVSMQATLGDGGMPMWKWWAKAKRGEIVEHE